MNGSIWWGPFPRLQTEILTVISHGRRGKLALWSFFYKGTILFMQALTSWPNYLPKVPPCVAITLSIRFFNTGIWGEQEHSDHSKQLSHLWHEYIQMNAHASQISHLKLVICAGGKRQAFSQDVFCCFCFSISLLLSSCYCYFCVFF